MTRFLVSDNYYYTIFLLAVQISNLLIFSLIVVVYTFKPDSKMSQWFGFLKFYSGKGLFFIFIGVLGYTLAAWFYTNRERIIFAATLVYGVILIILYFAVQRRTNSEEYTQILSSNEIREDQHAL